MTCPPRTSTSISSVWVRNAATFPSVTSGESPLSMGMKLPPEFLRRSTIQPQVVVARAALTSAAKVVAYRVRNASSPLATPGTQMVVIPSCVSTVGTCCSLDDRPARVSWMEL